MHFLKFVLRSSRRSIAFEGIPRGLPKKEPESVKEFIDQMKQAHKDLPKVFRHSMSEMREMFKEKLMSQSRAAHMSYKYFANFREMNEDQFYFWPISTDASVQGRSVASFEKHPRRGTAVFSGCLDTTVPLTGDIVRSGVVNVRSPQRIIFGRVCDISLLPYNFLVIRYRGDGRTYTLNIHLNERIDVLWHDQYTCPLYTQGGPYWHIAKIPFHQFFLGARGRLQDIQVSRLFNRVRHLSISLMDRISGEFNLEIDYIGLLRQINHNDVHSYEMYTLPSPEHRYK